MSALATTPPKPAPVSIGRLIAGAWRETRRTWPILWPVWLLSGLLTAGVDLTFRTLRPDGAPFGGALGERFANGALSSMAEALVAAMAMPVLLRLAARPGAMRAEYAAYARAYILVSVGFGLALQMVDTALTPFAPMPPLLLAAYLVSILVVGAMVLAPWVLWTVSQLSSDGRLSLADAWRIGRGGAWAYSMAYFIPAGVPALLYWLLMAHFDQSEGLVTLLASAVGGLLMAWDTALSAAFFRQRLGLERPETMADVFD